MNPSDDQQESNNLLTDLRNLLLSGSVSTQDSICAALEEKGHVINQSKVSRLLHKIHATKSKNEAGQVVYRLSQEPAPPTPNSELGHLVMEISANESLIFVKTSPGAAQVIARIIDYHKEKLRILGSIAGDDSIFIAPKSVSDIQHIQIAIENLLATA